ncbi:Endonuclease I [compost metagenome]
MKGIFPFLGALVLSVSQLVNAAPDTFAEAKVELKQRVYYDTNTRGGELYCGCKFAWVGKSGGRMDLASCGYVPRSQPTRAARMEWEHIVPAWVFGHQRQCWQQGGRKSCESDPVFSRMEADMHNLAPSVGEVNGDRSNFAYGALPSAPNEYGQCTTKVDFQGRTAEPRDEVKGLVARATMYMYDRYGLSMSRQQQQLMMAWSRMHPVSDWERERDRRIAAVMGHGNPFVTGERTWTLGYKPTAEGLRNGESVFAKPNAPAARPVQLQANAAKPSAGVQIVGNRNSHKYHLPQGCPGYNQVGERNRVYFDSAEAAEAAGYSRAGNCR